MTLREHLPTWFRPAAYLSQNAVTMAGAVLTTSSAFTILAYWIFDLTAGGTTNPYLGVIFFLILPGIFAVGLVLMPVGALWQRQKLKAAGQLRSEYPKLDFSEPIFRRAAIWVAGLTALNAAILSVGTYRGVQYMDSAAFCGQTCHTVMQPEFTAYANSPHQRVGCVDCHIGPGAGWFVRSKLSGLRQVYAVSFHTYDRPIPSPVEQLRPARETCEQCHWPQKFTGDKLIVRKKYSDDEKNTLLTTVLMMKIGGHNADGAVGIHGRHLDAQSRIQYLAVDRQRQSIPHVVYLDDDGKKVEFVSTDAKPTPEQMRAGESRAMDCIDCHNRPAHNFEPPERAVDDALSAGRISTELPFIKKKAVEVLKATYPNRESAAQLIAASLNQFYRTSFPDAFAGKQPAIAAAIAQIQT